MTAHHPTLVDPTDSLHATSSDRDSWWFAARLHHDETVFWAQIHAMTGPDGTFQSTVALLQESAGSESHNSAMHVTESLDDVSLSADSLSVRTQVLTLSGDLNELEISGTTDTTAIRLTLRREEPVLYSGGAGLFPFFGGNTGQYALPGLATSGTVVIDGVTYQVYGRTWFDRQWGGGQDPEPARFTWLGLDLGAGRYISVWDTTGDGTSWLTELRSDGTHTIARAHRTGRDGHWTLTVPALDASLEITHRRLSRTEFAYTGAATVTGKIAGQEVAGYGFADIVG
ncbi:lipocalin-like domain-containing protein [Streptomyces justiciae]|uniref:lipocalin-like domain-containing protein n=1 Tax=Streptomyces justiciae TaxID=2780140 RepID=UPI0021191442|nr:lipocalin-like domain-containing protein [Streptomyces justiciae]MCW8379760.1 hypothetical protein [Streptomyces justiciae]